MSEVSNIFFEADQYLVDINEVVSLLAPSIASGLDLKNLLSSIGLASNILDNPLGKINIDDCWRIFNAQSNFLEEESHLLSQRPLPRGSTRLVFNNLLHCKSLEEGLEVLADTYNVIHGGDFNRVRKRGNTIRLIVDDRKFHYAGRPQYFAIEYALLKAHCVLCFLAKKPLRLMNIGTLRPTLPSYNHHLNLFFTKIYLSQRVYELVYDIGQSESVFHGDKTIDVNGNLFGYYMSLHSSCGQCDVSALDEGTPAAVKAVLHECFARHMPYDQASVAETFHISVATLRRRLKNEGTTFRILMEQVNAELAVNVLCELKSSEKTAEKLGYCDVRSFKRAFRRWHGVSPAVYLSSHRRPL
ncbi:MAG: AraC family transcriptional regulator [Agarilytica sp.]